MSFDVNRMCTRLGVRLGSHDKLRSFSAETTSAIAERTLVHILDGKRSSLAIAEALTDDPKLDDIPMVVIAAALPSVIECINGAISDAQDAA